MEETKNTSLALFNENDSNTYCSANVEDIESKKARERPAFAKKAGLNDNASLCYFTMLATSSAKLSTLFFRFSQKARLKEI